MAQGGGGLYAPFPEPAKQDRAQDYAAQLGLDVTSAQLEQGRVLRGPVTAAPSSSRRAGVGSTSSVRMLAPLLAALLAAALVAGGRRWSR